MMTHFAAIFGQDASRLLDTCAVVPQETTVIVIFQKTQVLAFLFGCNRQATIAGDFAYLILRQFAQWEENVGELFLAQYMENI